jgi:hypothetical protein
MVTLHATFRLRDDALAKFGMLFKDDSVERSLCVLAHAQMAALAIREDLLACQVLIDDNTQ